MEAERSRRSRGFPHAALHLDCVYGRGPDDQPYLYEDNGVRFLLGRDVTGAAQDPQTRDVPRNTNPGRRARAPS